MFYLLSSFGDTAHREVNRYGAPPYLRTESRTRGVMDLVVRWRAAGGSVNPCAPHRLNTIPRHQTRSFVYRPLIITRSMWDRSQVILMSIEGALFIRPTTAMSVVISVRCELTTLPLLSPRTTSQSHRVTHADRLSSTRQLPLIPLGCGRSRHDLCHQSLQPRSSAVTNESPSSPLASCRSLKIEFGEAHRGNEGFEVRS